MTDQYAVIGNPISHSKSPLIHAAFAKQTQQAISYEKIEAPLDGFAAKVKALMAQGYQGVNVTVPFKFEAYQLCDSLSERAQTALAVNTLVFKDGQIVGDNTDGIGLVTDIMRNHQQAIAGKRVLLMGAGGAAYGVVLPLLEAGAKLYVANRTAEKAIALAAAFNKDAKKHYAPVVASGYAALLNQQFDLIINATSTGLTDELPPISADNFAPHAFAYDMMYSRETEFKKLAALKQVRFADGLGMLVEQAAEAFYLWRGLRPDTQPVIAHMRQKVAAI